jgi:hypothetical protein
VIFSGDKCNSRLRSDVCVDKPNVNLYGVHDDYRVSFITSC